MYKKKIAEGEKIKQEWEKELKNKEEQFEIFPEKLSEVKEVIRNIVMREAMRRLLTTQDHLRNLAKIRQIPYAGMTLRVINFQERKYPQQYYRCPDGFSFVQAFINLCTW